MWLQLLLLLCTQLLKFLICSTAQVNYFVMYKMAVLSKIQSHSDAVDNFKELPFYNKSKQTPKKPQKLNA